MAVCKDDTFYLVVACDFRDDFLNISGIRHTTSRQNSSSLRTAMLLPRNAKTWVNVLHNAKKHSLKHKVLVCCVGRK